MKEIVLEFVIICLIYFFHIQRVIAILTCVKRAALSNNPLLSANGKHAV